MPAGTLVSAGSLVSPGGQQGPSGPNAVSTDAGNQATFGSDNKIYVPDPTPVITSVRLRTFNAVGNPTFETDQISGQAVQAVPAAGAIRIDRWSAAQAGTGAGRIAAGQQTPTAGNNPKVPGTNYCITSRILTLYPTTQQATMGAGDYIMFSQILEGPQIRELLYDVSSMQILARCMVAPFTFCVSIRDGLTPSITTSFLHLCTITTANVYQLFQIPNIPVFPSAGNFNYAAGVEGCRLGITLACGSTYTGPSTDSWLSGSFIGASGMGNIMAQPVNTVLNLAFIQWEPGPVCTTLIDKPLTQNYDECLRYFCKSYPYNASAGTITTSGLKGMISPIAQAACFGPVSFPKPMAKIPAVTIYNHTTGAANSVQDGGAVNHSGATAANIGDSGFPNINFTTATTGAMNVWAHYTADTGW